MGSWYSKCYEFGILDGDSGWVQGPVAGITEGEENVTGVRCITPDMRKEKVFHSNGKVVRWVKGSMVHVGK